MNTFLNAALEYRARGWSVIPLNPGSKQPAIQWKKFQEEIASEELIARWWGVPGYNIGIVTGAVSNLVVIDVDDRMDGVRPTWTTLTVKTPNGRHYYFSATNPVETYISKTGLGIRGEGGYVVAPPSRLEDGSEYEGHQEILTISSEIINTIAPRQTT